MYTDESLQGKLQKLADTQDSINLLSHWLIFHRKNAREAVHVWATEFGKASTNRKLAFLHLANDVLQVSRKKADDFVREFAKVLPANLKQFAAHAPSELVAKVRRLLAIWEERGVYAKEFVADLKNALERNSSEKSASKPPSSAQPSNTPSSQSHAHHQDTMKTILHHTESIKHIHSSRLHLERTISTSEPSIDPVTVASQVSALTNAFSSELNERKKLIDDLKKWIHVEEQACAKIVDAIQEFTTNPLTIALGKDFQPPPSLTTSPTSSTFPSQTQPSPSQASSNAFKAHAPPAAGGPSSDRDFDSHTPIMSPISPPPQSKSTSSSAMDTSSAMDFMSTLPPPPPPPPIPGSLTASASTSQMGADSHLIIPAELLLAAQNAIQNNDPASEEVLNLLNGLTGGGAGGGVGGLFGFGGGY
ncbi:DUF618-domain-containing protein [Rhizoclosmatium globosum]|uniref:DUF618-domain-containing protein n=1 Tax=Rhizoclosmatium globosum TaxID=329046 RepID=A0A1Y2BN82_9FUNG|nr:DUF618-domain-containing protein [Rhizoclosmatium globosum]|eukprot:ORY36201.1 DUF618-domain-containing protein [Rhizoclosmatium globosum]